MTISRLERGVANPSLPLAHAIARELGASLDVLFPDPTAEAAVS